MERRYQLGRHWQGTRLSAAMISTYLEPDAKTAIDIGSNEGALTVLLAKLGVEAIGLEGRGKNRDVAEILASEMGLSVPFEDRIVTVDDLEKMEPVDVSLLLSVHHQIVGRHGLAHANEFLRALASKTKLQLFFQPACILRKYKKPVPFGDNDIQAIIAYFFDLLGDIFPHRALIGYSINDIPKREPLRPMLLFSHTPIEPQAGRDVIGPITEIQKAKRATHPLVRLFRSKRN